jgi:4-alpha-glucanotransferase
MMQAPVFIIDAADPAPSIALPPGFSGTALRWRLVDDAGFVRGGDAAGGERLALPANLPPGTYRLALDSSGTRDTFRVLARPPRAYLPEPLERGGRAWGFGVNLYALRSARNWGIGDFSDLRAFVEIAGELGASLVGINPLHALNWVDPDAISPYSPLSRFFLNPIYIDVEAVPEFATDAAARELVNAGPVAASLKRGVLQLLHLAFQREASSERRRAFARFIMRDALRLQRFARYEVLNERFARESGAVLDWLSWPEAFRDPASPEVERFALEPEARYGIDFSKYLQFLADEQLAAVAERARRLGVGLYLDLAVGVADGSADVWAEQNKYLLDRTVGAPPDPLGPLGQNWGLAPLDPVALAREGGASMQALLRVNMAHAGALRIDHVMSLKRLFLIPRGGEAKDGSYVEYPLETLLAIAAIESARAKCLVIGEDLGTVPDGFRERMEREGILSYRVLLFGREADGGFSSPESYPASALATGSTHDLPTLPGWVLGRDIDARARAGLASTDETAHAHAERRVEATRLLEALHAAGELDFETVEHLHRTIDSRTNDGRELAPLVAAAYRFLARTPARIVLVQLDDILGELDQINLPGTFHEYPNWRRKNGIALEDIAGDERVKALAEQLRARIGGGPGG